MSLNARKVKNTSGPKAPLLDEGAYPARLVQIIDLGLQPQEYKGETKPPKNEMWTTYELVDEFMPDEDGNPDEEKPRWMSEQFPLNHLNSDRAKSTSRYYALDPNEDYEGDWPELIGRPVLITIVKKVGKDKIERNYIGGTSTMRAKEADKLPELVNPPKLFLMSDPDIEVFLSLPEFLQDKIKNGLEFEGSELETLLANHKGEVKGEGKEKKERKVRQKKEEVKEEVDDSIPFDADEDDEEW